MNVSLGLKRLMLAMRFCGLYNAEDTKSLNNAN